MGAVTWSGPTSTPSCGDRAASGSTSRPSPGPVTACSRSPPSWTGRCWSTSTPGAPMVGSRRRWSWCDPTGWVRPTRSSGWCPSASTSPLRSFLGWVERFTEAAEEDRVPGTGLTTLRLGSATVGPLISYESTFPDMRRRHARAGVDLTLVQAAATTVQGMGVAPAGQLRGGASGRVGSAGRAGGGQRYVRGVRRSGAAAHLGRPARDRRVDSRGARRHPARRDAGRPPAAHRARPLHPPDPGCRRLAGGARARGGAALAPSPSRGPGSDRVRRRAHHRARGHVAARLRRERARRLERRNRRPRGRGRSHGTGRPDARAAADRSPGPDAHGRGGRSHLLRIGAGVGGRVSLRGAVQRRLRHIGGCPDGRAVPDLDRLAPEHLPQEQARVPGHIPGAVNIAWSRAANDDGTFLPADELRALYGGEGIDPGRGVITYFRIGERSAHTWFVLHELLGYPSVENYDGSWTEYGSLVG